MRPAGPRAAAVAALLHQEQGGYANLVLDAELDRSGLTGRDRAFAGAVFYTTVEKQAALDYILGRFLPKGVEKLDPPVRAILRSGLAQARFMQVPPSAAVNEAVKLTRAFGKASAAGLVNAVLRKACGYDLNAAVFADETRLIARANGVTENSLVCVGQFTREGDELGRSGFGKMREISP